METQRAYYEGRSRETVRIIAVRPYKDMRAVLLDRTIFYPEGGGQGSDRGSINGVPVLNVVEVHGEILHLVPVEGTPLDLFNGAVVPLLEPGPADLALDTDRRRDLTVQHTAQHLLSGIILSLTRKPTVSMNLGEDRGVGVPLNTIDVDTPEFSSEALVRVEEAVTDIIEADAPVIIHWCPPEDVETFPLRKAPPSHVSEIRVVEIHGIDFSPCCGTHLASTGAIGMLRILGTEKYKNMTRISFIAGRRVLRHSRRLHEQGVVISRALKAPIGTIDQGVLALLNRTVIQDQRIRELEEESARLKARNMLQDQPLRFVAAAPSGLLVVRFPDTAIDEVLRIGRAAQKLTPATLVLAALPDAKFAAFCRAPGADVRTLVKGPMETASGRGGGGPSFFQGMFPGEEALTTFLDSLPG